MLGGLYGLRGPYIRPQLMPRDYAAGDVFDNDGGLRSGLMLAAFPQADAFSRYS